MKKMKNIWKKLINIKKNEIRKNVEIGKNSIKKCRKYWQNTGQSDQRNIFRSRFRIENLQSISNRCRWIEIFLSKMTTY